MNPDDSRLNPYESPRGIEGQFVPSEPWLKAYEPEVMPRDVWDVILGTTLGVLVAALAFGVPLGFLWLFQAPEMYYWVPIVVVMTLATLAMVAAIRQVELSADELIARRILLPPLRIRWSAVTTVRAAGRWEAFVASILLPYRSCSYTFTSRDQICIETEKSKLFFPAKEADAFRASARMLAGRNNPDFAN